MNKLKYIFLGIILTALIIAAVLYLVGYFNPKSAGLYIETIPNASVYVGGEEVGRTPYKATSDPGNVTIKLVPESFEIPLAPYETKVNLVSGVETILTREFGQTNDLSAGEVLSFERVEESQTGLSVITNPDSSQVIIDGTVRGFSPYTTTSLPEGEHILEIKREGYVGRNMNINIRSAYKLTAVVSLAPSSEELTQENEKDKESLLLENEEKEPVAKVTILDTGVGFLRVRKEPSTLADEVGRVIPGRDYVLLGTDEDTGWYNIVYEVDVTKEASSSGWISNTYAEIVEDKLDTADPEAKGPTPTPS
ncbi:PEGA domain-containing protein [Candidatus Woesebacteria bacterium]|nr:PEGA domain-containing protein [Candidatus Woesebacteria bacterium]